MSTWTTQTIVDGTPEEVLAVLTAYPGDAGRAEVWATVTVKASRSLGGRIAAASTEALLRGGALSLALRRIAAEVERTMDRVPA